ncbi:hypothetical protein WISP_52365 [Willisornis vidua]|uniref:Uncharacterized protein n=1 Tax=Willisornis vidua TaxID=1566151 RepID=A0ABQ9DE12_9PASS|nr:hypothetical protein WISP_52365 [Willisornis vidua]
MRMAGSTPGFALDLTITPVLVRAGAYYEHMPSPLLLDMEAWSFNRHVQVLVLPQFLWDSPEFPHAQVQLTVVLEYITQAGEPQKLHTEQNQNGFKDSHKRSHLSKPGIRPQAHCLLVQAQALTFCLEVCSPLSLPCPPAECSASARAICQEGNEDTRQDYVEYHKLGPHT